MNRIRCWDPESNNSCIAVNMTRAGLAYARASTLAATPSLLWVGGFAGEVLCRGVGLSPCENEEELPTVRKLGQTSQNIINHIHALEDGRALVSSNDCKVRELCMKDGAVQVTREQIFDYPHQCLLCESQDVGRGGGQQECRDCGFKEWASGT